MCSLALSPSTCVGFWEMDHENVLDASPLPLWSGNDENAIACDSLGEKDIAGKQLSNFGPTSRSKFTTAMP